MNPRSWSDSVWFFDLDDTLINTAETHAAGVASLVSFVATLTDERTAVEFGRRFGNLFDLLLAGYKVREESDWLAIPGGKDAFDALVRRIESAQPEVVRAYGHAKKWSREIWFKLVADDLGLSVSPAQVQASSDASWDAIASETKLFDGARALLAEIRSHGRPLFIVTSSDGRLVMGEDGLFSYDPAHSLALKTRRVEAMRAKGLWYDALSIGDPEDKPSLAFFQKGVAAAEAFLGRPIDPAHCVMVGDSYGGDLATPRETMGFGLVTWFNGGQAELQTEADNYLTTGNLASVADLFY